jgi:hypothetical protein
LQQQRAPPSCRQSGEPRRDKAAALIRAVLKFEPDLTISTLQARMSCADDRVWKTYSDGLRRAGMPE